MKNYLKKVPGRFDFIFTPTHGFWLKIIETFFSKTTRSFLRSARFFSKDELKLKDSPVPQRSQSNVGSPQMEVKNGQGNHYSIIHFEKNEILA